MSIRHRIENRLRLRGWGGFPPQRHDLPGRIEANERKAVALRETLLDLAREVDGLTEELERLRRAA